MFPLDPQNGQTLKLETNFEENMCNLIKKNDDDKFPVKSQMCLTLFLKS